MLCVSNNIKSGRKGIFFSIDAVFALYIALLLMTAFVAVLQIQTQTNENLLQLSRLARDIHQIRKEDPTATLPSGFLEGGNCGTAETVGSTFIIIYDTSSNTVRASSQTVCTSG